MAGASRWSSVFSRKGLVVIGMIHVHALPGSPRSSLCMSEIVQRAVREAGVYREAGLDALMVENMHDRPYLRGVALGSEVTAAMTRVACEVRNAAPELPLGVQVLAGGNREAVSVALASGASFIRAECFVYSHVADEGWMDAGAGELMRHRRTVGADHVLVLADIKKKHCSHTVTEDVSIAEIAAAAEFFTADGVIVTGSATAQPAATSDLETVRAATALPLLVGSGVTVDNLPQYIRRADGLIVGSEFKKEGVWSNDIDIGRVNNFMRKKRELFL